MTLFPIKKLILLFLVTIFLLATTKVISGAEDCNNPQNLDLEQINGCIGNYKGVFDLISKANQTNKASLQSLNNQILSLKKQIDALSVEIGKKEKDLNRRNREFDKEYSELSTVVRSYYIQSHYPSALMVLFNSQNASDALRQMGIYSFLAKKNRDRIAQLAVMIGDLQKEKTQLENIIRSTSNLKIQVDEK
ncbi:MAG: hypothetical protein ACD_31C00086G0001, partial [uncultured bacterium]